MNTRTRAIASASALAAVIGLILATAPPAQSTDGKTLYREYCKGCHTEDSPHGEYTPMTLIQDQWHRFYERKFERTHKDVIDDAHGGKPVTEVISPEDLELIREFSIEGAADSEHPMTCG